MIEYYNLDIAICPELFYSAVLGILLNYSGKFSFSCHCTHISTYWLLWTCWKIHFCVRFFFSYWTGQMLEKAKYFQSVPIVRIVIFFFFFFSFIWFLKTIEELPHTSVMKFWSWGFNAIVNWKQFSPSIHIFQIYNRCLFFLDCCFCTFQNALSVYS